MGGPAPEAEKCRRTVPLVDIAIERLREQRDRQQLNAVAQGREWDKSYLVFTGVNGEPLHETTESKRFQRDLRNTGTEPQRFRTLRHAAANYLPANGATMREVMEISGHSSVKTSMDLYTHLDPGKSREAADRMQAALGQGHAGWAHVRNGSSQHRKTGSLTTAGLPSADRGRP
jgi:integrase